MTTPSTEHRDTEPWELAGADHQPIVGNAHRPAADPKGVLLIAHGFKGYKDYGLLPTLANRAAKAGFTAHRFNFSHSGMTRNVDTFERPDLFEKDTWSKQVHDLLTVHRAVYEGELGTKAKRPIVWFGHSRGGVACLLAARHLARQGHRAVQPVGIITAASPHVCCSLSDADQHTLLTEGSLLSPSGRTGQDLRVGKAWLEEQRTDPQAHDPYAAAGQYPGPRLILHGTADTTVPVAAAHAYHDAVGGRGQLELIENANHVFDAPNPLALDADPPPATERLIERTIQFATEACSSPAD